MLLVRAVCTQCEGVPHMLFVAAHAKVGEYYKMLKDFCIKAFLPSHRKQAKDILSVNDLGDRKPSTLVKLYSPCLATSTQTSCCNMFLRSLPPYVQDALAGSDTTDLETLGNWMDDIMSSPYHQSQPFCNIPSLAQVEEDLDNSPVVHSLYRHDGCCHRFNRCPSTPATSMSSSNQLCFYHRCYRCSARCCQMPCSWV